MNIGEFGELSAAAAVGALSPADRVSYEAALAQHPEWASIVRADADTAALLADAIEPVAPPAHLRDDLLARIAATPHGDPGPADPFLDDPTVDEDYAAAAPATIESAEEPAPQSAVPARAVGGGRRGWFALAASIVLVLAVGFGAALVGQTINRPAAVVALEQIEQAPDAASATVDLGDGGTATAHWSNQVGRAALVSDDMPALANDKSYELWLVRAGKALPAGLMDTASGATSAVLDGEYQAGDVIAVTIEPAGGSPDGTPSGEPIVAIPTA